MCDMSCLVLRGPLTMGDDIALPADYMYYTPSQSSLLPDLLSTSLGTLLYLGTLPARLCSLLTLLPSQNATVPLVALADFHIALSIQDIHPHTHPHTHFQPSFPHSRRLINNTTRSFVSLAIP